MLAYPALPVKRQDAAVRVQESGASGTHVGPAPAPASHECRAPADAEAELVSRVRERRDKLALEPFRVEEGARSRPPGCWRSRNEDD
jgi:hypothetical protein